jgi:hypothetical protein
MENPDLGSVFGATFTDEVCASLVASLGDAYDTACEHHVPGRGGNEATFGVSLYHYAVHELCSQVVDFDFMKVESRNPVFRLRVGEYLLACHRVGKTEKEDIWSAFPNNESAAPSMVEEQLWLASVPRALGVEKARKLILAHFGNPEDGFRAVYICVPGKEDSERINSWNAVYCIWRADMDSALQSTTDLVREEVVAESVVQRKPVTEQATVTDGDSLNEVVADRVTVTRKNTTAAKVVKVNDEGKE